MIVSACGCAGGAAGPAALGDPHLMERVLMGRNEGLMSLRAGVEARISFAGRRISLPGVLVLQRSGRFRLDLLDPLDRPAVILFPEEDGIVQYRPALKFAASLSPFARGCDGVDPAAWVEAVLANVPAPTPGDEVKVRTFFGGRYLEYLRRGRLLQSVKYSEEGGEARPAIVSWYCDEGPVLQLKVGAWGQDPAWRLPQSMEINYLKIGLQIRIDLKETEANPPPGIEPLIPPIGSDTRWSVWNLPQ